MRSDVENISKQYRRIDAKSMSIFFAIVFGEISHWVSILPAHPLCPIMFSGLPFKSKRRRYYGKGEDLVYFFLSFLD